MVRGNDASKDYFVAIDILGQLGSKHNIYNEYVLSTVFYVLNCLFSVAFFVQNQTFKQCTPEVQLRLCIIVGLLPGPLLPHFPSQQLLPSYDHNRNFFSDAYGNTLKIALIKLVQHDMEYHKTSMWVENLRYLVTCPEGLQYLNYGIPHSNILKIRKDSGWDSLARVWHFFGDVDLSGFITALINICVDVSELLGFIGCLNGSQLECIYN